MIMWIVLAALQAILAVRVLSRLARSTSGIRILPAAVPPEGRIAIVIPVLDERARLGACLNGVRAQTAEVAEILVVDGGSRDGTPDLVRWHATLDPRIRLVDASPVPPAWTGKAWGLAVGLRHVAADVDWVLCLDADVRPAPLLARSLLAHAERTSVAVLSVATRQRLGNDALALLHPSLLATIVYRHGAPGGATADASRVMANGQCFLVRRDVLRRTRAVHAARDSLCEDITIARRLARAGERIGFYEASDLVSVQMYRSWREAWEGWPRSLPMRDRYFGWRGAVGLAEVALVQAAPIPLAVLSAVVGSVPLLAVNLVLAAVRIGVLVGMARAYLSPPWTYWLSPLTDLPVAVRLIESALRRRHRWRGRRYVRNSLGRFQLDEGVA